GDVLAAWQAGQQQPLAFCIDAALAYVAALAKEGEAKALQKARKEWDQSRDCGAENRAAAIVWRGQDPLELEAFHHWALRLAGPLLAASQQTTAAKDAAR
ncbi:MAG: hypothetical protein HQL47_09790, partial [Gammaproteobacteria bacterium]|nr:hypothetical protein [Gammaproteobacteria bacterium]